MYTTTVDWPLVLVSVTSHREREVALLQAADDLDNDWSEWLRSVAHRLQPASVVVEEDEKDAVRRAWRRPCWCGNEAWGRYEQSGPSERYPDILGAIRLSRVPPELLRKMLGTHVAHTCEYDTNEQAWRDLFRILEANP